MIDPQLVGRLAKLRKTFAETLELMGDSEVLKNPTRYAEIARRHAELRPAVEAWSRLEAAEKEASEARDLAKAESDPDMVAYFTQTAEQKDAEVLQLERSLRLELVPKDPDDERDVLLEMRAAVGGEEAAIFAGELLRMYERYAQRRGWKTEMLELSVSESKGVSKATLSVKGKGAYSRLKYEAGPHRVQRVPRTESQGRIHTSIATVAVLPEVEPVEVDLKPQDLRIDVFRSSGPGGQSVNTTDSAVRVTHLPTGLVVSCQDEKSQLQNKDKAIRILRARLYQASLAKQQASLASDRRSQVGSGERSEKIRTYNFRENRVTDHRVNLTLKRLPEILEGDLDEFVDALTLDDEARRLAEG